MKEILSPVTRKPLHLSQMVLKGPYLLTAWSRVLLAKLICSQIVKKFRVFYGT